MFGVFLDALEDRLPLLGAVSAVTYSVTCIWPFITSIFRLVANALSYQKRGIVAEKRA